MTLPAVVTALAAAGAMVPAVVLLGWAFGAPGLPSFASGSDVMVPWSAVGCLAAGLWVLGWRLLEPSRAGRAALVSLAGVVTAIGLIAALENLAGLDLGVDSLLWPSSVAATAQSHVGRASLQTAIALAVLGVAELALVIGRRPRTTAAAGLAACGVMALGLLGLTGRALQITPAFTSDQLGSGGLSVPTAAALALLGAALAAASLGPGLLASTSRSAAARRQLELLLPVAIAIPLIVFAGAYASIVLSGSLQVIGPMVAATAVVVLMLVLRLVNLGVAEDVATHSEVERGLNDRIALYGAAVESSDDAILTKDLDGTITSWNPAAERLYGYSAEEAIGQSVELVVPDDHREELRTILRRLGDGERVQHIETIRRRRDGHRFPVSLTISPFIDASGRVVGASSIARDVTERRRAESQLAERTDELRQAQKMEAIGRLAGGVAHDFNNLLTVIIGATQLLEVDGSATKEDRELLDEISDSARQAAALTAQLLAFGRRSPMSAEVLDINELLAGSASMLARMIGSDIEFIQELSPETSRVRADPNQFQQVIMNLVVNARDAMPTGGKLTIATEAVELSEPPFGNAEIEPGSFVRVDVADTGTGMDAEQLSRIFEPFYTTKEAGKGTGLGLSTSHGIVSQLGGHFSARSEPGEGTTFSILLPRVEAPATSAGAEEAHTPDSGGSEAILLVDDQEALRRVTVRVLRGAGYEVLEAGNGAEAVEVADAYDGQIDLLLTDLVMPEVNGYELAEALRAGRSRLKILFMSGYPPEARERYGEAAAQGHLQKPFAPDTLRRAVRVALDRDT